MKSRIVILFLFFLALWSILLARSIQLQVFPDERLKSLRARQSRTLVKVEARRGLITDRNGKELAGTVPSHSLFADPKRVKNPYRAAHFLGRQIGQPWREVYRKITRKKRRFVWLKRFLPEKKMKAIRKKKFKGISFIEEPVRVYPSNHLLSQVLGFVGVDNKGLEGLELHYDDTLQGINKNLNVQRDAHGRPLLVNGQIFLDVPDGSNLGLTIDSELQFVLEEELALTVKKYGAKSAVGIVLAADTSEVLALANYPTYNPNHPKKKARKHMRNHVVIDAIEPGSVIKTFVAAAALREHIAKPNTKFDCGNGKLKIGKHTIHEADAKHHFSELSLSDIIAYSSNIGITNVAFELGEQRVRQAFLDFGFGAKSGIDFPGEARGKLSPLPWNRHKLSNISFGQAMTATPLQVANAYAAIANGGILNKPYIVKSIWSPESKEKIIFHEEEIRRVLSEAEAATMRLILHSATSKVGTGFKAQVSGFPVAGKTGTAQIAHMGGRGYEKGAYYSSFVGFVPVNKPKFVIFIGINRPESAYYASEVAAPLFAKIASSALRQWGMAPILVKEEEKKKKTRDRQQWVQRFEKRVADQMKFGQTDLAKNALPLKLPVKEQASQSKSKQDKSIKMLENITPNLIGMSLRDVYREIHGKKIKVSIRGSGLVAKTWPRPGKRLKKSKKMWIKMEMPAAL